jgi:glycosyltransferase involved in cell wall biosynthesis
MTDTGGEPTREVLVVSYFFPPLGGVSVPRMISIVRHLPESGWRPVVIAPRGTAYGLRDPAGLAALPSGLEVIRAASPEPHSLRRRVEPLLRPMRVLRSASPRRTPEVSAEDAARVVSGSHRGRLSELRRRVFFPDDQVGWVPFASRAGIARARRHRPDVIYSTAFPISSHLVAGAIHRATGIPWVAEFRDPWVDNVIAAPMPRTYRNLQRRIERWIVTRAARTVLVTPGLNAMFAARYPSRADRLRTIMNGYDSEELLSAADSQGRPTTVDSPLRLVYTGTLNRPRETVAFLDGLERFVAAHPDARDRLRVELIGTRSPEFEAAVRPYLAPERLGPVVELVDFMPRRSALQRVGSATAALVTMGDGPGMGLFVSGKLFDYIGLDRPVFAVAPPGDLRAVLESLDWGIVADPEPASVASALDRLWNGDYRRGRADPEGRFDRRNLTRDLAAVLDEAIETS